MSNEGRQDLKVRKQQSSFSPAVTRAALILELLAEEPQSMGVSEIARRLDAPRSTAANILGALEQTELIRKTELGYELGPILARLARAYLSQTDIVPRFYRASQSLSDGADETVLLAELDGTDIVYLARHEGAQLFRIVGDVGERKPAEASALGHALLASLQTDVVAQSFDDQPPSDALLSSIAETQKRGYALDDEDNTVGLMSIAIALPVLEERRFAVGITVLRAGATEQRVEGLVNDLKELVQVMTDHEPADEDGGE